MTTLFEEPATRAGDPAAAERLRTTTAAMRLSFTWFGVRKALSDEQKARAADAFGAEGDFLSAGKKLLDTRDPVFKAVSSVRSRAVSIWRSASLPFPEPGIRLIRQDELDQISERMSGFRAELIDAVAILDARFESLKSAARERLGRLYNPSDNPATLDGLFDMTWEFPSVEPPDYLRLLSPDLYRQECERVQARFDEAIRLAEAAFLDELSKLVEHLTERLTGTEPRGSHPRLGSDRDGTQRPLRRAAAVPFGRLNHDSGVTNGVSRTRREFQPCCPSTRSAAQHAR